MKVAALYVALAVFVFAFAGCENDTTNDGNITWTLEQFGGIPADGNIPAVSTTGIIIKFSAALMYLDNHEITISGAAIRDTARGLTFSGNNWTVPIIVIDSGYATVAINKTGVAGGSKNVTVYKDMSITVNFNALFTEVFDKLHITNPIFGRTHAHGSSGDPVIVPIRGSVINYKFDELAIDKNYEVPVCSTANPAYVGKVVQDVDDLRNNVSGRSTIRPGALKPEIKYIIYHDTANTGLIYNGDALAHAIFMRDPLSNTGKTSWHYTVDSGSIYQSIPDIEVAWHAGNAYGNLYSIGIESCVNYGVIKGDFFQTWQRMAKLIAYLLDEYDLPLEAVLSHKEISEKGMSMGLASFIKCCPQTLRHAELWQMAKDMIKYELLYLQKIDKAGYKAELIIDPDSSDYIDEKGRVIKLPSAQTTVSYTVKITAPDSTFREKRYYSVLRPQGTNFIGRCDVNSCVLNGYTSIQ